MQEKASSLSQDEWTIAHRNLMQRVDTTGLSALQRMKSCLDDVFLSQPTVAFYPLNGPYSFLLSADWLPKAEEHCSTCSPTGKKIAEITEEAKLLIELPLGGAFQRGSISFREMHCRHFSGNNPRIAQPCRLDSLSYYPNFCTTFTTTLSFSLHRYI